MNHYFTEAEREEGADEKRAENRDKLENDLRAQFLAAVARGKNQPMFTGNDHVEVYELLTNAAYTEEGRDLFLMGMAHLVAKRYEASSKVLERFVAIAASDYANHAAERIREDA